VSVDPFTSLDPKPTGFGTCARCPYRDTATVMLCYRCARQTMRGLARYRCQVCDQALTAAGAECRNSVCNWPDRQFMRNYAIAMRDGALEQAINAYKYGGRQDWALIFGRVLAGFLYEQQATFEAFDLVTPSPTYVGPGGRSFDHTAMVLRETARMDATGLEFALDPPVIVQTGPTRRLVPLGWQERRHVCEVELPPVLKVPDPSLVHGKAILVYDDVFTDGLRINAVAKKLREAGAGTVSQVTLARQPWGY
jgi:predicted amidophosphoribosyltransferase